ncbi:MAG: transketolase [Patescibacteria group bacterium]|jgi:transketolase
MKTYSLSALNTISANIREDIISMLLAAGSGHSAGPLGMADVFTALYFCVLNHAPHKPRWDNRDRLVLSCGHLAPLLYATLARAGYFPKKELKTLRKLGSLLQGHPHNTLPGVETSTGPLGQGISVAVGMSLGAALLKRSYQVYCVMSDAEQQEGQTWEAVMFAGKNRCANLTAIIDRNNIQIDGYVENVMPLEPLRKKYEAFNWHVIEVDGHNIRQVIDACNTAKAISEKPVLILCHTIPGKGVDFMEFSPAWHGKTPTAEEARRAHRDLHRLRTLNGKIISEHE